VCDARSGRMAAALVACVLCVALHPACGESGPEPAAEPAPQPGAAEPVPQPAGAGDAARLRPDDLVYKGAFRLPGPSGESDWAWSGDALAYHPGGDAKGPDDGYPGSLFGIGHDHQHHVSEISIPAPVVSKAKNLADLPTAKTLQPFADVRAGHFTDYEIPRAGLTVLPPMGPQTAPKLYFCFGQHMHEGFKGPTHCWCDLDLAKPNTAGPWRVGQWTEYVTAHYLFAIPTAWADAHTGGRCLATGRFRDGGQGGQGPALFAIGPWLDGNPPAAGASLKAVPLLLYTDVTAEQQHILRHYHHADEWTGAAWLTAGAKAAVVFVGTKGLGKCWYGFANGVVWPEEGPWPPVPPAPNDQRGWWSTGFEGQMLFYDPSDLAAVAAGKKKPWEPQPYAVKKIDDCLLGIKSPQQLTHVRGCAFDRQRGHLYVVEFRGDQEDKSLVHVWTVRP